MSDTERLNQPHFTFDTSGEVVAQNLIGAVVITGDSRFIISEVEYFPAEEITGKVYQDAKYSPPGTVTGSVYRGRLVFPNISTSGNDLIMPRAVLEITPDGESTYIEGPGRVAKALGIEKNGKYELFIQDPYSRIFYLTTTIPEDEGNLLNNR